MSREAIPAEAVLHEQVTKVRDPARVSIGETGRIEIAIAFAAIHTTSTSLTHVLFDIAAHPNMHRCSEKKSMLSLLKRIVLKEDL